MNRMAGKTAGRTTRRRDRGAGVLGLAALVATLAAVTAGVMLASVEGYAATATAERRVAARLAAEGAALAIARGGGGGGDIPARLGDCDVSVTSAGLVRVTVNRGGRAVYSAGYEPRFEGEGTTATRRMIALDGPK